MKRVLRQLLAKRERLIVELRRVEEEIAAMASAPVEAPSERGLPQAIAALVSDLDQWVTTQKTRGRPPHRFGDVLFGLVWRTFTGQTIRAAAADLVEAAQRGLITQAVHHNALQRYANNPETVRGIRGFLLGLAPPATYLPPEGAYFTSTADEVRCLCHSILAVVIDAPPTWDLILEPMPI